MVSRRQTLTLIAASPISISGCTADYPGGKRLEIHISSTSSANSGWRGEFKIKNQTNLEGEEGSFNDVMLVGISGSGKRLCTNSVGKVPPNESRKGRLSCDRIPAILTCDSVETPCDDGVVIEKLVRIEETEASWRSEPKDCQQKSDSP